MEDSLNQGGRNSAG